VRRTYHTPQRLRDEAQCRKRGLKNWLDFRFYDFDNFFRPEVKAAYTNNVQKRAAGRCLAVKYPSGGTSSVLETRLFNSGRT
jgi:hypothetical protein